MLINMPTLKEEIKQTRFESAHQEAAINLIFTHTWVDARIKKVLKPYKASPQQYNVLRILRGAFPEIVSSSYIKERMIDKESNITRLIDKLVIKKYVVRNLCPSNRRKMDISITELGLRELKKMDKDLKKSNSIFEKLSKKEANKLNKLLDKIRS